MSKVIPLDIIEEIGEHAKDMQKLLTRLMCANCTTTLKRTDTAIKAQTSLGYFQENELDDLGRAFKE